MLLVLQLVIFQHLVYNAAIKDFGEFSVQEVVVKCVHSTVIDIESI